MSWWGTVIGGAFGFMMGGPLGALFGAAIGNHFDKGIKITEMADEEFHQGDQQRVQMAFFTATFAVMGHIAKSDGRVSKEEIEHAKQIMTQLGLSGEMREAAIRLFNEGKKADFDLAAVLHQFKQECHRRTSLIRLFLEIQVQAAYADGVMYAAEKQVLLRVCQLLGVDQSELDRIEQLINGSRAFHHQQQSNRIEDAYQVLGIDDSASDKEVKRAYRRLMSQHHPDKLVAKGLPDEMIQVAKEKTQAIRKAYEQIKKSRGMR